MESLRCVGIAEEIELLQKRLNELETLQKREIHQIGYSQQVNVERLGERELVSPSSRSIILDINNNNNNHHKEECLRRDLEFNACCGDYIQQSGDDPLSPSISLKGDASGRQQRLRYLFERRTKNKLSIEFRLSTAGVGHIIGRQGEKLSDVARKCKVEIRVLPVEDDDKRRVKIYGDSEVSLQIAKKDIESSIYVYQNICHNNTNDISNNTNPSVSIQGLWNPQSIIIPPPPPTINL